MEIRTVEQNGRRVACVESPVCLVTDVSSALDLMTTVRYETGCDRMALNKAAVCEDFFALSTRLAGEILQKFVNYRMKLAIYGDFTGYSSKALRDFIRESNRGRDVFFTAAAEEAVEKLSLAQ